MIFRSILNKLDFISIFSAQLQRNVKKTQRQNGGNLRTYDFQNKYILSFVTSNITADVIR